jgi:hypothetical protein
MHVIVAKAAITCNYCSIIKILLSAYSCTKTKTTIDIRLTDIPAKAGIYFRFVVGFPL